MLAGGPDRFVNEKVAVGLLPFPAVAVTGEAPHFGFAVKNPAVAPPDPSVTTTPPPGPNEPDAPLTGSDPAMNVTVTPGTVFPNTSRTVMLSAVVKAVLTTVLCGVPVV